MSKYTFKIAEHSKEFEQIHRLNAETFTREIPQHAPPEDGRLVDRFHDENTYVIARRDENGVVGMLAINDHRPFSLDQKLLDLDSHLPPHEDPCEFRLLSVEEEFRNTRVFVGLIKRATTYCVRNQYDIGLISGHVDRLNLYRKIGFEPFGPEVGSGEARYQPMYVTESTFQNPMNEFDGEVAGETPSDAISLMPGPVEITADVRQAYREKPVSHRSRSMENRVRAVRRKLAEFAGAEQVELLTGSGTLANEVVAAHISCLEGAGLILSSGEFGKRLVSQADRWGLDYDVLNGPRRRSVHVGTVREALESIEDPTWVWMVHCETSTGVVQPLSKIKQISRDRGVSLFVDCISTIGTMPMDLSGVRMATGVSGKAIGNRPGLSFVFHNGSIPGSSENIPRYLDLSFYAERDGIPFTISSNQVQALERALDRFDPDTRFDRLKSLSDELRRELTEMGYEIVAEKGSASPAILTLNLPDYLDAEQIGDKLKEQGYLVSYRSRYLLENNHIQICLMGDLDRLEVQPILPLMREHVENE